MPIEELETPETVQDEYGRPLVLTHVLYGGSIYAHHATAYSIKGILVNGEFKPFNASEKAKEIRGEHFDKLLAFHGNDFRVSDMREIRREIEAEEAAAKAKQEEYEKIQWSRLQREGNDGK